VTTSVYYIYVLLSDAYTNYTPRLDKYSELIQIINIIPTVRAVNNVFNIYLYICATIVHNEFPFSFLCENIYVMEERMDALFFCADM